MLREVRGNGALARVLGAYASCGIAEFGIWIILLLYAYDRDGATGSTIMVLVQVLPSIAFAPFAGRLADRIAPVRVLRLSYVVQAAALGTVALTISLSGPEALVFALAPCATLGFDLTCSAQAALFPAIVRTPAELTTANVLTGWTDGAAYLVGPAVAGAVVALGGLAPAVVVTAAANVLAAALVSGGVRAVDLRGTPQSETSDLQTGAFSSLWSALSSPATRLLLVFIGFYYVLIGALDVLCVVLAVSLLHLGQGAAGYLNAAIGGGGMLAAFVTVVLAGRAHLARLLAVSLLVASGVVALIGAFPSVAGAVVLLAVSGLSGMVFRTVARIVLQRAAPPESAGTMFAAVAGIASLGLAAGTLVVRASIAIDGLRAALFAPAVVGFVLVGVAWHRLRSVDDAATIPQVQIRLLRSLPIFAPLPPPELEGLARGLELIAVPAGTAIVREGDRGERYFVVADGTLAVTSHGQPLRTLGRGTGFGEIALVTRSPRTATVTATTDALLYGLDQDAFVGVLTGHPRASSVVRNVVASYGDPAIELPGHLAPRRHPTAPPDSTPHPQAG